LLRGLTVLAKQERDAVLKERSTTGGFGPGREHIFGGLAQHPRIFNDLYVNMVKAGELGGVLEVVLTRLAEFRRKRRRSRTESSRRWFIRSSCLVLAMGS